MPVSSIGEIIGLLRRLENETGLNLADMTSVIVGANDYFRSSYFGILLDTVKDSPLYTEGAAWRELRDLTTYDVIGNGRQREMGVLEAGGDTVAIGHVLAGIYAGFTGNLYGATVAGSLAQVIVNRQKRLRNAAIQIGASGEWDRSSCPPEYVLREGITPGRHVTRPELLGDIDGFVLGASLPDIVKYDSALKLSEVFESYYGDGLKELSWEKRASIFKQLSGSEELLASEIKRACERIRRKSAAFYEKEDYDEMFEAEAENAVSVFYKTMQIPRGNLAAFP